MEATPALPRELEGDPVCEVIRDRLAAGGRRLWRGGQAVLPVFPLGPVLAERLADEHRAGRLVLGLEGAAAALATEAHGLAALARRSGQAPAVRVSRLLLLSSDGAERFYRQVERIAAAHLPRLLVVLLEADAAALGRATTGRDAAVKAVLVRHKQGVALVLRALAG